MIEFFGEISAACKKNTERRRKRYYAVWTCALAAVVAALAVIAGVTDGQYVMFTVFAALLAALTVYLFIAPVSKSLSKEEWLFRVEIEEGVIRFTQYVNGREIVKKREVRKVRRVVKDGRCYLLYAPNAGSIIVCQRNLLKRGTFDELEALFAGKIKEANAEESDQDGRKEK